MIILYAAGETLEGADADRLPEDLKFEDEKLQLKHICREAIRKHLLELDPHRHLFGRISKLGLPKRITEYLLFNEFLNEVDSSDDGDDNSDDAEDNDADDIVDDDRQKLKEEDLENSGCRIL